MKCDNHPDHMIEEGKEFTFTMNEPDPEQEGVRLVSTLILCPECATGKDKDGDGLGFYAWPWSDPEEAPKQ